MSLLRWFMCLIDLHDWTIQVWKPEDGVTLVNGEPLPDVAYCWNCGKKRTL